MSRAWDKWLVEREGCKWPDLMDPVLSGCTPYIDWFLETYYVDFRAWSS